MRRATLCHPAISVYRPRFPTRLLTASGNLMPNSTTRTIAPGDPDGATMIPDQRRESMVRQLRRHKVLSVHQLMEMFACSHMTVRRDIAMLEQAGQVYSVPGGVRIASQLNSEPSHQSKALIETAAKAMDRAPRRAVVARWHDRLSGRGYDHAHGGPPHTGTRRHDDRDTTISPSCRSSPTRPT